MTHNKVQPWLDGIEGDEAKKLIESNEPLIRVIAGPGTGKTKCLKRRTRRLVEGNQVDPESIFVGTFTRAVAKELSEALGVGLTVTTLHSHARHLLQQYPAALQGLNLRFLLDYELDALLYDVAIETVFEDLKSIYDLRKALRAVQSSRAQKRVYKNAKFLGAVNRWMRRYRAMPIGEVLHLCESGMESGDIPSGQFDHVVIDEYQDLTALEQAFIQRLWSRKGSLVVLGDDDQSIYGFRFSNPDGITEFDKGWSDIRCADIHFVDNRRCGSRILDIANLMMKEAGTKKPDLVSKSGMPGTQAFVHWDSIDDEVKGLTRFIKSRSEESFLILVPRRFIGHLLADSIGSEAKTDFREKVLEHQIAQEAFARLSLIADPEDLVSVRAFLGFHGTKLEQASQRNAVAFANIPKKCNGRGLIQGIISGDIPVSRKGQQNVRQRAELAHELLCKHMDAREAVESILNLDVAANESDPGKRRRLEKDLKEIHDAALALIESKSNADLASIVDTLRYRIATRAPLLDTQTEHRVKIMTLHSAKGLQAENVIVAGIANQIMPGDKIEQDEIAEQRRLLYVAITRAKKLLVVSWPRSIRFNQMSQMRGAIDNESIFHRNNEKWVTTSKSSLIPNGIEGIARGDEWLRSNGI